jgi:hypothetical protein
VPVRKCLNCKLPIFHSTLLCWECARAMFFSAAITEIVHLFFRWL